MYSYPIDYDLYTNEEIIILIEFLSLIEDANTKKVDKNVLLKKYREYQSIINNQSTEKTIDREYQKLSGYSVFQTIKKYKDQ
jgi:uncharacterized protein YktA (UPF0223 family)